MIRDFKPINPHGSRPNRATRRALGPLFQVVFEHDGELVRSPKITREGAEAMLAGVSAKIIEGKMPGCGNPHLVRAK